MKELINISLDVFYIFQGALMFYMAIHAYKTIPNTKKYGTALFWILTGIPFVFGSRIPAWLVGLFIIIAALLTVTKQVTFGKYAELDADYGEKEASRIKNKIFLPSLLLAFVAVAISMVFSKIPNSSLFAIGASSIIALIFALFITKEKVTTAVHDGARLYDAMGPTALLPQLLVGLGTLFTVAGIGKIISNLISGVVPADNRLLGVIAYVLGMVIFTMVMGNAFAAFAVITAGIGVPFVLSQGANPAIAGALAMTAGFCGTLMTPMAANFNMIPVALLEMKDTNGVIKAQIPMALSLIVIHIIAMYFLAF